MGNIGACSQCGKDGVFQMYTPREPWIHYVPSNFLKADVGWVTVCPECEGVLGDINLRHAGYKWNPYHSKWVAPPT